MNMIVLKRSNIKPKAGDVFVYRFPEKGYGFGCVVRQGVPGKRGPAMLVYLYIVFAKEWDPIPPLDKGKLLVPPMFVWQYQWTHGLFMTVGHRRLGPGDVLERHCFEFNAAGPTTYWDEYDKELRHRIEPCGSTGILGAGAVDDSISDALGIPLYPAKKHDRSMAFEPGSGRIRRRRQGKQAVIVHFNNRRTRGRRNDLMDRVFVLEEQIECAVSKGRLGTVDGNEIALDLSMAEIVVYGVSADRMAEVILPIARRAKLPRGSYLLKAYDESNSSQVRIEL